MSAAGRIPPMTLDRAVLRQAILRPVTVAARIDWVGARGILVRQGEGDPKWIPRGDLGDFGALCPGDEIAMSMPRGLAEIRGLRWT